MKDRILFIVGALLLGVSLSFGAAALSAWAQRPAGGGSVRPAEATGPGGVAFDDVLLLQGTAANPSLAFAADEDTGLYLNVAGQLGLTTGGTAKLLITAGGISLQSVPLNAAGQRIRDSSGDLNLGTEAATSHSLVSGDVLVGGKLEVDDTLYLDADLAISGNILSPAQIRLTNSATSVLCFSASCATTSTGFSASSSLAQAKLLLGTTHGRHFIIGDHVNGSGKDFDHATATDPTLFVHSVTDPDSDNTQWISVTHDQTNGVIATGAGTVDLEPAAAGVELPGIIGTGAPTEPVSCTAANAGVTTYVDDTDDSAAAQVCICFATTDDGGGNPTMDWRDLADPAGTACSFF